MKLWVFITNDSYYGGWFSGAWPTKEEAIVALIAQNWEFREDPPKDESPWKRDYTYGDLEEIELGQFYGDH